MDDRRWDKLLRLRRTCVIGLASIVVWIMACSGSIFLGQLSKTLRLAMGVRFSQQDSTDIMFCSFFGAMISVGLYASLVYLSEEVSDYNDFLANTVLHPFGRPKLLPSRVLPKRKAKPLPSEYPPEFNDAVKRAIRVRDGYTCAVCDSYGKQVHHINYDKSDTRFANLITLCHSCHGKTGGNRNFWKGLLSPIAIKRTRNTKQQQAKGGAICPN